MSSYGSGSYANDPDAEMDLSKYEAYGAELPVGEYVCTIQSAVPGTSKNGGRIMGVTFQDTVSGGTKKKDYALSDKAMGYFVGMVQAAGFDTKQPGFKPSSLVGAKIKIIIAHQQDNPQYTEVKGTFKWDAPTMLRATPAPAPKRPVDPSTPEGQQPRRPVEHRAEQLDITDGPPVTGTEDDLPF